MPMSRELHLRCCFCGKELAEKPRVITVEVDAGGVQKMFAHTACLRDRLDPSVPLGVAGAVGIEVKKRERGWTWTFGRVITAGVILLLVLLIPALVIMFTHEP